MLYLASVTSRLLVSHGIGGHLFARISMATDWLGFVEFGWFASGALFFFYFKSRNRGVFWLASAVGILAVIVMNPRYKMEDQVAALTVVVIFMAATSIPLVQRALSIKPLLFFGFISYPLYLLHDNIMVGTISSISFIPVPSGMLPAIPLAVICLVAWLIAKYYEPNFRRQALKPWGRYHEPKSLL